MNPDCSEDSKLTLRKHAHTIYSNFSRPYYYIKVVCKGVLITWACYPDDFFEGGYISV